MQRFLYVIFFLSLICTETQGQVYRPMLSDSKEWHCKHIVYGSDGVYDTDGEWPYIIKVDGDSIINGVAYKKLHYEYMQDVPKGRRKSFNVAVRETGKAVFSYSEDDGDIMFVNFNLHEGDFVSEESSKTIIKEDSIEVNGIRYRRLSLSDGGVWVEGIGSHSLFFTIPYENQEGIEYPYYIDDVIEECYENGQLIFSKDDFTATSTAVKSVYQERYKEDDCIYGISGVKMKEKFNGIYIRGGRKYAKCPVK